MPTRPGAPQRWLTAASWPAGIALTAWDYMWRTTPMHRSEVVVPPTTGGEPPAPAAPAVSGDDLQPAECGVGPLFHRLYRTRIVDARLGPEELMRAVQARPNRAAPSAFARFQKVRGTDAGLRTGDEFVVRMPGPWDGPVRVVAASGDAFTLATLRGHLEAGRITFRASGAGPGSVVFEVESHARSSSRLVHLLYHRLGFAKEVQAHMWISFLEGVARLAGGRMSGGIEMRTRRIGAAGDVDRALRGGRRVRRRLERLGGLDLNFDPRRLGDDDSWRITDIRRRIGRERPGLPEPDGSFEAGMRAMRSYSFADPSIVRAFFDPAAPLEGRDMLLRLQTLGVLHLDVGVRVAAVYDTTRHVDGREVHVWGWSYRTLKGHVEAGQMDWELWKWLDTGEIDFRVHAVSRRSGDVGLVVGLVYRAVASRERRLFLDSTVRRMRAFVQDGGRLATQPEAAREVAAAITAHRVPRDDPRHDELARNLAAETDG